MTEIAVWTLVLASSIAEFHSRSADGNLIVPGALGGIVYRTVDGRALALDAFVNPDGKTRPGVLVVHGGGWTSGSRVTRVGQWLEELARAGFHWFSVDYRLGPPEEHAKALEDIRAAVVFVREHATELRTDPDALVLLGEDTGAYLACRLAAEKPAGVKAAALLGGVYDPSPRAPRLEPAPGMPPVYCLHGGADREVPVEQVQRFESACRAFGGFAPLFVWKEGIHSVENWDPEIYWPNDPVIPWLAERMKVERPEPAPESGRLRKNVAYGWYDLPPGKGVSLYLDAYVPDGDGPHPAVVIVHGGGWEAGNKVTYVAPIFEPLARGGFAWFSIDYRLTPRWRHEDQLADVRAAVRFVRDRAKDFRVDPERIALLGESASGQIAALLASEKALGLRAVVSFYGVHDLLPLVKDASPRSLLRRLFRREALDEAARELLKLHSPIHQAREGMAPVLLVCGDKDSLWEQSTSMERKLTELHVPHDLLRLEGAPHGMESWEGHPEWDWYKRKVVEWLQAELRREP